MSNLLGNILHLPSLVYERVLKDMDLDDLKSLRATCKTTRSWVETEEHLKRFNIHIFSSKFLQEQLLKSDTKWSSFTFSVENPFSRNMSSLNDFLSRFGSDVKTLYFATSKLQAPDEYYEYESITVCCTTILESCPNLQSLSLNQLDIVNCSNETLEILIKNWTGLEILEIHAFKYLKCSTKQSGFFKNVLTNCQNLKRLQLPRPLHEEGQSDERHDEFIIQPTIRFLKESGKCLQHLNIHRNDHEKEDLPCLRNLIGICAEKAVTVSGMSGTMEKLLSEEEEGIRISKIVGTLTILNNRMGLMDFSNLEELKLEWNVFTDLDNSIELPNFPKLASVHICFLTDFSEAYFKSVEGFITRFMGKRRDSVKKFHVRIIPFTEVPISTNGPQNHYLFLKSSDLVHNFRNLQELCLEGWMNDDDDFLSLWTGLSNLENLLLMKCANLTDRGFLGDDHKSPAILELKRLRRLYIDGIPQLTDKFYSLAVCQMKLKYFFASTTQSGLEALKKGPFRKSIQYFLPPTVGWKCVLAWNVNQESVLEILLSNYGFKSRDSLRKYFQNFKNLREPNMETWEFQHSEEPCTNCISYFI